MALGFNAEVTAYLCKGHLDGPAADEPAEDIERVGIKIGAQKGLRLELVSDVANQHVAKTKLDERTPM